MPDDPGSDDGDARIARREAEVAELAARLGCLYGRFKLSPPFHLKTAVEGWLRQGLTPDEIVHVVQEHLQNHRRRYVCGSGDSSLAFLRSEIARAAEAKHPAIARAEDEPASPRRKRGIRKVHHAGGYDVFVDGPAARLLRDSESNVERPTGLVGYEDGGDPIGEDDEADA
jgi:hypothetical protein